MTDTPQATFKLDEPLTEIEKAELIDSIPGNLPQRQALRRLLWQIDKADAALRTEREARERAERERDTFKAEVEHWVQKHNALGEWRAQTSRLHLEAELKVHTLRAEVEALRNELPSCDGCGHPAVDHEGHPLATVDKGACERFESTSNRLTAELEAAQQDAARLREQYDDLIYQVATKHPNETRHETAKRYIVERETRTESQACVALTAPADPRGET